MVAPNIVQVSTITGKTDTAIVSTASTTLTTCAANKVYKLNSIVVSNVAASAANITVDLYRSSVAYYLSNAITIPANATLVVVSKDMGIYLEESDAIRVIGSANSALHAICSYEIIG